MTDRDYVSTDHEAYMLGEGANKVHQGWSLIWRPSQDETLGSDKKPRQMTHQRTQKIYKYIKKLKTVWNPAQGNHMRTWSNTENVSCAVADTHTNRNKQDIICIILWRYLVSHLKFLTWSSTPDRETEYDKAMLYVPAWTDDPQFTSVDFTHTLKVKQDTRGTKKRWNSDLFQPFIKPNQDTADFQETHSVCCSWHIQTGRRWYRRWWERPTR